MATTSTPDLVGDRKARVSEARSRIEDAVFDAHSAHDVWEPADFRPGNLVTASGRRSLHLGVFLVGCAVLGTFGALKLGSLLNGLLMWALVMGLLALFATGMHFVAKGERVIRFEATRALHDQYLKAVYEARRHARRHPGAQAIVRDINATMPGFTELLYQLDVAIPAACPPWSNFLTEEDAVSARAKLADPEVLQDDAIDVLAQVLVACWDVKRLAASPASGAQPTKPTRAPRQRDKSLEQMREALERLASNPQ